MKLLVEAYTSNEIEQIKQHHADGVILSVEFFSARSQNYLKEEVLPSMVEIAKQNSLEVYVDVTRMFVDEEMEALTSFLSKCKELKVNGVYFSDMSVFEVCRDLNMNDLCVYQPDTMIVNSLDARLYLKDMKRVVLAKELTLEEKMEIAKDNPGCVEAFIHGRELMSISKRHLISNYFEEIDYQGQSEEYYYLKEEKRDDRMVVMENEQGTHFFAGYSLCSFEELPKLIEAQVGYGRISHMFVEFEEMIEALDLYVSIREGVDLKTEVEAYKEKYSANAYRSGFYYQKTSVKKEY